MKLGLILLAVGITASACTSGSPETSQPDTESNAAPSTEPAEGARSREVDIYSAVIEQLATEKDLATRYKVIYVVAGEIAGAGKPRGDPFGPPSQRFGQDVVAGIREQVADDLPPLRFVDEGKKALRNPDRPGLVKKGGVLIALGQIEVTRDRVHVPNTLWCGGKCSQWLTYVLARRDGRWTITGTSGPSVSS